MTEETIFHEALARPSRQEREAYLLEACARDESLLARVRGLLQAHEAPDAYLAQPAGGQIKTVDYEPIQERVGTEVGPYKLREQIGEGGFGLVFVAEQERPVRRRVALKIIKPGMDTKEVVARFEAERQALAMMDHPHIAKVLDAGATESGRPYFVMELVKGIALTGYCDQHKLTVRQRLELFVAVCQAVHHAHQKGVIHRDLKPSNVLVTEHDGTPVVKVIDFGVAKALHQRLTDRTIYTRFAQIVGTPLYMSPEQAAVSALDVDTRSDIYSLGVLLYELLTGRTPFDAKRLKEADFDELRRIIREEEPPRPSTRISTLGPAMPTVTAQRQTDQRHLQLSLRRDLDWIVMKALEKDRNRRFDTASALAADVQRYLADEPVLARPPSPAYRVQKVLRRHGRRLAVTATILVLLAAAGILGSNSYLAFVRGEQARAQRERERVAREEWLPQIEELIKAEQFVRAVALARQAEGVLPREPSLARVWPQIAVRSSVISEPPGATVAVKPWRDVEGPWTVIGVTPLVDARLPKGALRWRFTDAGPLAVEQLAVVEEGVTLHVNLARGPVLSSTEQEKFVRVQWPDQRDDFFVQRYEVTNREYQEFVDAGGYTNRTFWKHEIERDGQILDWEQALKLFCDATGKPGPAAWKNGRYPDGEADHPLRGVSWYEAAAYAEFRHQSLLPGDAWERAASLEEVKYILPLSNFSPAVAPVGSRGAMSRFGAHDMFGNVKEWCLTPTIDGRRLVRGGAWDEPSYMGELSEAHPPLNRLPNLGFRCAKFPSPPADAAVALAAAGGNIRLPPPVSKPKLAQYTTVYAYDQTAKLNAQVVAADDSSPEFRHETIAIDTTYSVERLELHLLLPKRADPPFQTAVYFPGLGAMRLPRFPKFEDNWDQWVFHLPTTGRAVCWPIYKGTYERHTAGDLGRSARIQQSLDMFRAVDYLLTRPDIDRDRLAYVGASWGAVQGPRLLVLEPRFQTGVLVVGGMGGTTAFPEIDCATFAPHVRQPVFMLNGRDDTIFPVESRQRPLFDSLGSANGSIDKRWELVEGNHTIPRADIVRWTTTWLDEKLGPVAKAAGEAASSPQARMKRLQALAADHSQAGRHAEAAKYLRELIAMQKEHLGSEHADALAATFALAGALAQQADAEAALAAYEEALALQSRTQAAGDPRIRQAEFAWFVSKTALGWLAPQTTSRPKQQRATEVVQRALDRNLPPALLWSNLAYAHYVLGNLEQCREAFDKALERDAPWSAHWHFAALLAAREGKTDEAKDWYFAADEWLKRDPPTLPVFRWVRSLAATELRLPAELTASDNPAEHLARYDRLLAKYSGVGMLHYRRGLWNGQRGAWPDAQADFQRASQHAPHVSNTWHALGVVALYREDVAAYEAACRRALNAGLELSAPARLALLCTLSPTSDQPYDRITAMAQRVYSATQEETARKALLMAHLRAGNHDRAFDLAPTTESTPIGWLQLALLHQQLGNEYTYRRFRAKAEEAIAKQIPTPAGHDPDGDDRPLEWCVIQILLRELQAGDAAQK